MDYILVFYCCSSIKVDFLQITRMSKHWNHPTTGQKDCWDTDKKAKSQEHWADYAGSGSGSGSSTGLGFLTLFHKHKLKISQHLQYFQHFKWVCRCSYHITRKINPKMTMWCKHRSDKMTFTWRLLFQPVTSRCFLARQWEFPALDNSVWSTSICTPPPGRGE